MLYVYIFYYLSMILVVEVTMNKQQIISQMKHQTTLTKKECTACLDALLDVIKEGLNKGEDICLSGFGKWKVQQNRSKYMYNPITQKHYYTSPKKIPVFKAGAKFKQCVK